MLTLEQKRRNKINRTWERFNALTVTRCKNEALTEFQKLRRMQCAGADGFANCISCAKRQHWKEMDGGHYISRSVTATAFNPHNVHAQCKYCNRHLKGNLAAYRVNLVATVGECSVLILETLKDATEYKLTKFQLATLRVLYKELQQIEKEKFE